MEKTIANIIQSLISSGFVWIYAWIFNPDIKSGTVWFIAAVVGLLTGDIYRAND